MRKTLFISTLLALFTLVLAACGTSSAPATLLAQQANVKLETNPSPAQAGDAELYLNITDQNGDPIGGAKVEVSAEHPDMKGMGMNGPATEQSGGKYVIKANFDMGGNWKITVYVRKGELDTKQEIQLEVK